MMEGQSAFKDNSGLPTIDLVSIAQALVVAECLSFHRAATVLGKEPSTVARRVRALEDVLGVSLFERTSAGVRPTTAGSRFFEQALVVLRPLGAAVQAAGSAALRVVGHVQVGIVRSIAAA